MRPSSVVLLQTPNGRILEYELYFSSSKATIAYRMAAKKSKDGSFTLLSEDGGRARIAAVAAPRLVQFGGHLATSERCTRDSFLYLSRAEIDELSHRFDLPPKVIEDAAQ